MKNLRIAAIAAAAAATAVTSAVATTAPAHATLPATKVTAANLPTADQVKVPGAHARVVSTVAGSGQEAMTTCQTHVWGDYKPNAEFTRMFSSPAQNPRFTNYSGATIASFATHAAAVKAAGSMASSFACNKQIALTDGYLRDSARTTTKDVTLKTGQVVHLALLSYDSAESPQVNTVESNAVVATGTHVELVSLHYYANDGTANSNAALATVQATLPTLAK